MANFTIKVFRPNIVVKSVEYEKEKFAKFMITQEGKQFLTTLSLFLVLYNFLLKL